MLNGYEKEAGVISSPEINSCPKIVDGEECIIKEDFVYELQDGRYCSFDRAPNRVRVVDDDLKTLLESYAEKEYVEFIPVIIRSERYGDRQYYIMHFKKIYDVIDEENTVYCPENSIIKLRVDYKKVKDLHVFNSQPLINDLIVSRKVYSEIKRRKLNFGTSFGIIYSVNKDK